MKTTQVMTGLLLACGASNLLAMGIGDDPLVSKVLIHKLENRFTDGPDPRVLDWEAWVGYDFDKLWLKSEIEWHDGETEAAHLMAMWRHAVDPYWDVAIGLGREFRPRPEENYLVFGATGTLPYMIESSFLLEFADEGQVTLGVELETEYMLSQQWVLMPSLELDVHNKADEDAGHGAGLSKLEAGLRLAYEFRREFAPFVGVVWEQSLGQTADLRRAEGEDTGDVMFVAGIHAWF